MGKPMAVNLIEAGYELMVYDINPVPVAELAQKGAQTAASSKEAAAFGEVIITMLPNSPHLKAAVMGKDGVLEGAKAGDDHAFEKVVHIIGDIVLDKLPIACGIALVDNFRGETARAEVAAPRDFYRIETGLLEFARSNMPKIPFNEAGLLIVDQKGKNISGSGMDSKVIGRIMHPVPPEPKEPVYKLIYVRDLTEQSKGNAMGVGAADFASKRLAEKFDPEMIRANSVTSMVPQKVRIPLSYETDSLAIADGLFSSGVVDTPRPV